MIKLTDLLVEAKKVPSAGLTKKQKTSIEKKIHKGEKVGHGGFDKVAKAAEKQYGSKEAGQKVAAAAMWKSKAKKMHESEEPLTNWQKTVKDSYEQGYRDAKAGKPNKFAHLEECDGCERNPTDWNPGEEHMDHEASMADGELRDLVSNASKLINTIQPGDDLPGWVSAYITLASDYIHSVQEFMHEQQAEMQGQEELPAYAVFEAEQKLLMRTDAGIFVYNFGGKENFEKAQEALKQANEDGKYKGLVSFEKKTIKKGDKMITGLVIPATICPPNTTAKSQKAKNTVEALKTRVLSSMPQLKYEDYKIH